MKIRDFTTEQAAQTFKLEAERLGWTCSSIWSDDGYTVTSAGRTFVGRWHIVTNWPF